MWESRSDFQGLWEERETAVWFSSLSIARHFHSRSPVCSRTPSAEAYEELSLGLLHLLRSLRIGLG
jgi:hypothetical protein